MRLVVDASAVVALALSAEGIDYLRSHRLLAPRLITTESVSALHKRAWLGEISTEVANTARDRVLEAPVEFTDDIALHRAAWAIADRFGWAKTYDANYVALAQRKRVPLVTEDARLRRRLTGYLDVCGIADL